MSQFKKLSLALGAVFVLAFVIAVAMPTAATNSAVPSSATSLTLTPPSTGLACCYGDCMDHCTGTFNYCHDLCNDDCEACAPTVN